MRFLAGVVLAAALAGCTTYEQGVGSYWTSASTLKVSGSGNGFTDPQRVTDFVYLQAAEAALSSGYGYFVLRTQYDTSTVDRTTVYTPTTTNVTGYTYGNTFSGTATTTGGPQSYSVYKPGLDAVFEMFDRPPSGYRPGQYWDATEVYHELGPKYLGDDYIPDLRKPRANPAIVADREVLLNRISGDCDNDARCEKEKSARKTD